MIGCYGWHVGDTLSMQTHVAAPASTRHREPAELIAPAVWRSVRCSLSFTRRVPAIEAVLAALLNHLSICMDWQHDPDRSESLATEALVIARASSDDIQRFTALFSLARLAAYRGAYVQASTQYREALGLAEVLRNTRAVATVRVSLADLAALQGNTEDAVVLYAEAQPLCRRWGMISYVGVIAVRLGVIF